MGMLWIDGARGVKVPVRLLRRANRGYETIQVILKTPVGCGRQTIRSSLQDFIRIGVVERIRRWLTIGEFFAPQNARGTLEIAHSTRFLTLLERKGNRD